MNTGFKNNNKSTLVVKSQYHTQGITVQNKRSCGMGLVAYSVCDICCQRLWLYDNDFEQKDVSLVFTSHAK
jgi:hypothetical protein